MTIHIAINGFNRIGRNVVHTLYKPGRRTEITVVAINELTDAAGIAHLLRYDTSHSRFAWDVRREREQLLVGDDAICLPHESTTAALPWRRLAVGVVLDCISVYKSCEHGGVHLQTGAKEVLFSHPGGNDLGATMAYDVNQDELRTERRVISNVFYTTSYITPVAELLDDTYGIGSGTVTIVHSATHDQQVIDAYHLDLRRACAASQSTIPVDTKLATGIIRIFPQLNDHFETIAVQAPTINMMATGLSVTVKRLIKACEVNQSLQKVAQGVFHSIVGYTKLPLVSTDFNHDPHSAIVDGTQTRVSGAHLIKTLVWCDNGQGSTNRMFDTTLAMAAIGFRFGA